MIGKIRRTRREQRSRVQVSPENASQPWPPEVQHFVREEQERAYRSLGSKLGLGGDAAKAYAHLSRPQMPLSHISWKEWAEQFGVDLSSKEEEDLVVFVKDQFGPYFTEPPTPYEDRNRYPVMAMVLDEVLRAFAAVGKSFEPRPVVATLPSGEVNAVIQVERKTSTPIIFFEQGLFQFLYDFALAIGWAMPVLSAHELSNDQALARHHGPHMVPFGGGPFPDTLYEYVVSGTPMVSDNSRSKPAHNLALCELLLNQMTRFVVAHELSHIALGHLNQDANSQDEAWMREYYADAQAVFALSEMAHISGQSRGFTFWACDLCLLCLDLLDRAIGLMASGSLPTWASLTHPDAFSRSHRLRELLELGYITHSTSAFVIHLLKRAAAWMGFGSVPKFELSLSSLSQKETLLLSRVTSAGHAAEAELGGMSYAIMGKLWEFSSLPLLVFYSKGQRPSPIWETHIASCFKLP